MEVVNLEKTVSEIMEEAPFTLYDAIFREFFDNVIKTNKMLGLLDVPAASLIPSYQEMLKNEIDEVFSYTTKENLVKELLDVLVVGGFLYYLQSGRNFISSKGDASVWMGTGVYPCLVEIHANRNLPNVLWAAITLLCSLPVNIYGAVNEVIKSNLSKFSSDSNLLEMVEGNEYLYSNLRENIAAKIEKEGRYSGVFFTIVKDPYGVTRTVFWCTEEYGVPKHKYLKGLHYKEADIEKFWIKK